MNVHVLTKAKAVKVAKFCRKESNKLNILFTNGCFDGLHAGHMELLNWINQQSDTLVIMIGVNTDASIIQQQKERTWPLYELKWRIETLRTFLSCLPKRQAWKIIPFGTRTPLPLIKAIRPDFVLKGKDYADKPIIGEDFITSYGGHRLYCPVFKKGVSTSIAVSKFLRRRAIGDDPPY